MKLKMSLCLGAWALSGCTPDDGRDSGSLSAGTGVATTLSMTAEAEAEAGEESSTTGVDEIPSEAGSGDETDSDGGDETGGELMVLTHTQCSSASVALADCEPDADLNCGSGRDGMTTSLIEISEDLPNATAIMVDIELDHTFVGDLRLRLLRNAGDVLLLDELPNGGHTCPAVGLDVTLWDSALGGNIVQQCTGDSDLGSVLSGDFKPAEAVDQLLGAATSGEWILEVTDTGPEDTGTLSEWCLHIEYAVPE